MKILYDYQIFETQKFGGINRYFKELVSYNVGTFNSEFIELDDYLKPKKDLFSRSIRFIKSNFGYNYEKIYNRLKLERLKSKITHNDYNIFHPTYYEPYYLSYIKAPFIITVHDMVHELFPDYFKANDNTAINKKLVCEQADAIIAISETTKKDLIRILNIDDKKITTIYHGSNFHKIKASKPILSNKLGNYLLYTGQRWSYKNFDFMIENLAEYLINDEKIKLVCTGSSFNEEEIELFNSLKISEKMVHFYAKDDNELAWLYQNAIAFIFPSIYEGFGFPLLEAFASKCPVISSDGGALKEIGGKGAYFFNPTNKNEFKTAVNDVLYNSEIRKQLIENGLIEYNKYSWDICREQTLNVYKKVLNKHSN